MTETGVLDPDKLRVLRLEARLSIRGLARAAGVDATHLGRYERGTKTPSPQTLGKLADYFGTRVTDLTKKRAA